MNDLRNIWFGNGNTRQQNIYKKIVNEMGENMN